MKNTTTDSNNTAATKLENNLITAKDYKSKAVDMTGWQPSIPASGPEKDCDSQTTAQKPIEYDTDSVFSSYAGSPGLTIVASTARSASDLYILNMALALAERGKRVAFIKKDIKDVYDWASDIWNDGRDQVRLPTPNCEFFSNQGFPLDVFVQGMSSKFDILVCVDDLWKAALSEDVRCARNTMADIALRLSEAAKQCGIEVWCSHFVRHGAGQMEVPSTDQIAENRQLADVSDAVLMIGRVKGYSNILTAVPRRPGGMWKKEAFRLECSESGRLRAVPRGSVQLEPENSNSLKEPVRMVVPVNVGSVDGVNALEPAGAFGLALAGLNSFGGTNGFVPVSRTLSASSLYTSQKYDEMGILLSLMMDTGYGERTLSVPGGKRPITVGRGQVMMSLNMLARRYDQISTKRWRNLLSRWEQEGLISIDYIMPCGNGTKKVPKSKCEGKATGALGQIITLRVYAHGKDKDDTSGAAKGKGGE